MTSDEKTDKAGSKVHLGAVDRSWIGGAILTLSLAAVSWGYKIDNRQSVHETRQEDFAKRQDEMVLVLNRLTNVIDDQKSATDRQLPRIDQRLADIERRLDRLDADGEEARNRRHGKPDDGGDG